MIDLDRGERRLIVAALRLHLALCHQLGCVRCREVRDLVQKLEVSDAVSAV